MSKLRSGVRNKTRAEKKTDKFGVKKGKKTC